jgi:hypothetical protein
MSPNRIEEKLSCDTLIMISEIKIVEKTLDLLKIN